MADSDSESDIDSDSDKKETSPLYYHIGGEAKKKISLPLSLNKNCLLVTTISWEVASPAAFLAAWENGKLPGTKKRVYGKMTYFCGIHAIILQRKSNPRFRSHEKTTNARQSRNPEFHHSREQPPHVLTTVRPPHVLTTVRRGTGEARQAFPPWHAAPY